MVDRPVATRRTILKAAGVTLGTAALGSATYAATRSQQEGGGASVDWYNTYTESGSVDGVKTLFDVDDGYVVIGEGRITKLTSDGNTAWSNSLPDSTPWYEASTQTSDGAYLHADSEHYDEAAGGKYGIAVKTDERGEKLWRWSNAQEDGDNSQLDAVVAGPNGGGYAFGHANSPPLGVRFDADGTVLWKQTWDMGSILEEGIDYATQATDGGAVVYDIATAARITPNGTVDWTHDYGKWAIHEIDRRADSGYVAAAANYAEQNTPALLFLSEQGEHTRTEQFEVPNDASVNQFLSLSLARTADGLVIGSTSEEQTQSDETDKNAWVLGLTPSGDQRWYVEPGDDANEDRVYATIANGQTVLTGGGWMSSNDDSNNDGGSQDAFVARLTEGSDGGQPPTESPTESPTQSPTESPTQSPTETTTDTNESATPTDTSTPTEAETGGGDADGNDCEI